MALEVLNFSVSIGEKEILKDVTFRLERGETAILMGPNGGGKTTLSFAIMGHPKYNVSGKILLDGEDISELPTHERALKGLGLAFQNPVEIPGLRLSSLLNAISIKKRTGELDMSKIDPKVIVWAGRKLGEVGLDRSFLEREVNIGFSGGEKKRSEIVQLMVMDPKYLILDEPDSGLDVDGIRIIGNIVNDLKANGKGTLIITHHAEITKFVKPDKVMIMLNGSIAEKGGVELIEKVESKGYKGYER